MSHVVTIRTEIRDAHALRAACHRLGLPEPVNETVKLLSAEATGYSIRLHDWRYPVVCQVESGQIAFDNHQGRWGQQRELDRLIQAYAVEKTRLEARRKGHICTEAQLADGSVKLTIQVAGGIA